MRLAPQSAESAESGPWETAQVVQGLQGHMKRMLAFALVVAGGRSEGLKQEGDGFGGMCRAKSRGQSFGGKGAETETEKGWSEKQGRKLAQKPRGSMVNSAARSFWMTLAGGACHSGEGRGRVGRRRARV